MNRFNRRLAFDGLMRMLATIMALIALAMMGWILTTLVIKGANALSLRLFYLPMGAPDGSGGLANAIVGSLIQVALATVVAAPVGVMAGTYLSELGQSSRFGNAVRFINDVLLSAPSILIGLFVYDIAVRPFSAAVEGRHLGAVAGRAGRHRHRPVAGLGACGRRNGAIDLHLARQ